MKNFSLSIFFIFTVGMPFIGTYHLLLLQKKQVRREIKKQIIAGIEKENLVFFRFGLRESNQLFWEHPNEFEYKGNMYDVVLKDTIGDSVYYWCWRDNEETRLNGLLGKLVKENMNNDPATKAKHDQIIHFLESLFSFQVQGLNIDLTIKLLKFNRIELCFSSTDIVPPVPPPKNRSFISSTQTLTY